MAALHVFFTQCEIHYREPHTTDTLDSVVRGSYFWDSTTADLTSLSLLLPSLKLPPPHVNITSSGQNIGITILKPYTKTKTSTVVQSWYSLLKTYCKGERVVSKIGGKGSYQKYYFSSTCIVVFQCTILTGGYSWGTSVMSRGGVPLCPDSGDGD